MDKTPKRKKRSTRKRRDRSFGSSSPYTLMERLEMRRERIKTKKEQRRKAKKLRKRFKESLKKESIIAKKPLSPEQLQLKKESDQARKKNLKNKRKARRKAILNKHLNFWKSIFKKTPKRRLRTREIERRKEMKYEHKKRFKDRIKQIFTDPFGYKEYKRMYPTFVEFQKEMKQIRSTEISEEMSELAKNPLGTEKLTDNQKRAIRHAQQEIKDERKRLRKLFFKHPILYIRAQRAQNSFRSERLKDILHRYRTEFQEHFAEKENIKTHLSLIFNSTALFVLAYLFVFFISKFITIFAASKFGIDTKLFYYGLDFPIATYSLKYNETSLIITFASAPIAALLSGILLFQLFKAFRGIAGYFKLFLLWASLHFINIFAAGFTAGAISRTGFIYAIEWAFKSSPMGPIETSILVLILISSFFIGKKYTNSFLSASNSRNLVKSRVRWIYLLSQVIIPWLLGTVIILLSLLPNAPFESIVLVPLMAFLVLPIMSNVNTPENQKVTLPYKRIRTKPKWILYLSMIAAIVVLKVILSSGIWFN